MLVLTIQASRVTKVPPPVLGFNNNVRHRGRVFHIQTEDSGVRSPRLVTHLFADGGRIIKTARTDYTEHLGRADLAQHVRHLMKEQHKAMYIALRSGKLDEVLELACGPLPLPASAVDAAPPSLGSGEMRAVTAELVGPPSEAFAPDSAASPPLAVPLAPPVAPAADPIPSTTLIPVASRKPRVAQPSNVGRPASRYASAPGKAAQSIFGDGVMSEKSLDEVILSYLGEDAKKGD